MKTEDFNRVVEQTLRQINETLLIKGKEYRRNGDVFHNFNQGAKRTDFSREEVLQGFQLKHEISVSDLIQDAKQGKSLNVSSVEEKLNDILIYTLILKAMLIDRALNQDL